jgi:hypothetical protein
MATVAIYAITAWADSPRFQPGLLYLGTLWIDLQFLSPLLVAWIGEMK